MSLPVCHGATLNCTLGTLPGRLLVLPGRRVRCGGAAMAEVADHRPLVNIVSFGRCRAGWGQGRCIPETPDPWSPGAAGIVVATPGAVALDHEATLACRAGGVIRVVADMPRGVRLAMQVAPETAS